MKNPDLNYLEEKLESYEKYGLDYFCYNDIELILEWDDSGYLDELIEMLAGIE